MIAIPLTAIIAANHPGETRKKSRERSDFSCPLDYFSLFDEIDFNAIRDYPAFETFTEQATDCLAPALCVIEC